MDGEQGMVQRERERGWVRDTSKVVNERGLRRASPSYKVGSKGLSEVL